jgi:hypothetical protein
MPLEQYNINELSLGKSYIIKYQRKYEEYDIIKDEDYTETLDTMLVGTLDTIEVGHAAGERSFELGFIENELKDRFDILRNNIYGNRPRNFPDTTEHIYRYKEIDTLNRKGATLLLDLHNTGYRYTEQQHGNINLKNIKEIFSDVDDKTKNDIFYYMTFVNVHEIDNQGTRRNGGSIVTKDWIDTLRNDEPIVKGFYVVINKNKIVDRKDRLPVDTHDYVGRSYKFYELKDSPIIVSHVASHVNLPHDVMSSVASYLNLPNRAKTTTKMKRSKSPRNSKTRKTSK